MFESQPSRSFSDAGSGEKTQFRIEYVAFTDYLGSHRANNSHITSLKPPLQILCSLFHIPRSGVNSVIPKEGGTRHGFLFSATTPTAAGGMASAGSTKAARWLCVAVQIRSASKWTGRPSGDIEYQI